MEVNEKPLRFRGKRRREPGAARLRREYAIYIFPNLFTTANLFCGFFAIIKAIQGDFVSAAYLILAGGLFDLVDGRVARITHSSSPFGMEYDSICDVITFGIAPSMLVYLWSLQPFGRVGWLVAFLFLACGALRLARFNVQSTVGSSEKGYFKGLPIPMAAAVIATSVLFHEELVLQATRSLQMLIITFVVAFLMVSTIRFKSFKDFDIHSRHAFSKLVFMILMGIGIAAHPEVMMFVAVVTYIGISIPAHFLRKLFPKAVPAESSAARALKSENEGPV